MKKFKTIILLVFGFTLLVFSFTSLKSHPIILFVLKVQGDTVQAYKVNAYLNGVEPTVEAIGLTNEQKKEGGKVLDERNESDLEMFSKNFGSFSAVIGMPTTQEDWPEYLGNGLKWFKDGMAQDVFDNLQWTDRLYLAMYLKCPPLKEFSSTEFTPGQAVESNPTASPSSIALQPTPENPSGIVRVEILNGCGITNAAEWAARRMQGQGITIVDSGNADNFKYPKTIVRISGEMPAALEEALGRLGLSKDSIQNTFASTSKVDAVVIVGKDFHLLKGHRRERNHNREE